MGSLDFNTIMMFIILMSVFILFALEKFPADLVAMGGFALCIALGIISQNDALHVFSNHAPLTIGAMFILSAALERTGCIDYLAGLLSKVKSKRRGSLYLYILPLAMLLSAFMNNTPIIFIMAPMILALTKNLGYSASKFLIPLSYASILGGMTTIIGTSTNLLVNGIVIDKNLAGFSIFDITPAGSILALSGFLYIVFIGRHLLPERTIEKRFELQSDKKFLTHLLVPIGSRLIGQSVKEWEQKTFADFRILDLIRRQQSKQLDLDTLTFQAGDFLIIETEASEVMQLKEIDDVEMRDFLGGVEQISAQESIVVEAIVGPQSPLIHRAIPLLRFQRRYGCYILGVHRPNHTYPESLRKTVLHFGDTLLIEGPRDEIEALFEQEGLIHPSIFKHRALRKDKWPWAVGIFASVVILASFNLMPISMLALIGAVSVIFMGCIDVKGLYKTIDWSILFLIFGMLGLSKGLQNTHASQILVEGLISFSQGLNPIWLLIMVYFIATTLTEMVSNNAVAVLLTPIVIDLTHSLHLNPYPFIVAVMFASSASFATPIGYQTNTYVYRIGGYRFRDFLKIGLPLNLFLMIVAAIVIPMFWSFK